MSTITSKDGTQLYYKDRYADDLAAVIEALDLKNLTLVMHGEDDQIVPVHDSAKKAVLLIENAAAIYYPGAPHDLTAAHQDRVNAICSRFFAANR